MCQIVTLIQIVIGSWLNMKLQSDSCVKQLNIVPSNKCNEDAHQRGFRSRYAIPTCHINIALDYMLPVRVNQPKYSQRHSAIA